MICGLMLGSHLDRFVSGRSDLGLAVGLGCQQGDRSRGRGRRTGVCLYRLRGGLGLCLCGLRRCLFGLRLHVLCNRLCVFSIWLCVFRHGLYVCGLRLGLLGFRFLGLRWGVLCVRDRGVCVVGCWETGGKFRGSLLLWSLRLRRLLLLVDDTSLCRLVLEF